ncbi:MAG TPA: SCP2 sterol-binding domain-containing protein [Ramlibacter sp.]
MRTQPAGFLLAAALAATCVPAARAQDTPAMSPAWAQQLCTAWNADTELTGKLVESGWIRNDAGRGYKAMQIWRADCQGSARVEMRIALKDDKALCVQAGAAGGQALDRGADYQMWADTARWREMGAGEYGPMKAMMFGRLQFDGPKMEAMGNMGPFAGFLRLVGQVPGNWAGCP